MTRTRWVAALGGAVAAGTLGAAGAAVARRPRRRVETPDGRHRGGRPHPAFTAAEVSERPTWQPPPWPDAPERRVRTEDSLRLHVEEWGDPTAELTVVFVHGYGLNRRSWRHQRRDLADAARLVFYDQRSHGASARSPAGRCTIDQLGTDLWAVLDQTCDDRPIVLVGHSMGAMTVLALAEQAPELFGSRIVGVALLAASAGKLSEVTLGLPKAAGLLLRRVSPEHLVGLSKGLPVIAALAGTRGRLRSRNERGNAEGADSEGVGFQGADAERAERSWRNSVVHSVVGRFSFGSDVDPGLVADVERMIAATGLDTLAAFAPTFLDHDKLAALPALAGIPTSILVGEDDLMTPVQHSRSLAEALPDAELRVLPATGHMLILERPAEIEVALRRLLDRSRAASRPPELPQQP